MIQIKELTVAYEKTVAVNNISIGVEAGTLLGIVGPNGAGKSTLIKTMVGLLSEYSGEIYFDNLLLRKNRHAIKQKIGYAPENVDLMPYLTGLEYLQMIADIRRVENSKIQIEGFLSILNMKSKKDDLINSYSHGMLQKLSVAGAMIGLPPILIFDEAFNGFDPISMYNLKIEIDKHVQSGGIVLLSSHILEVVEKWCSAVVIIDKGKILKNLDKDQLRDLKSKEGVDFNTFFINTIQSGTNINQHG